MKKAPSKTAAPEKAAESSSEEEDQFGGVDKKAARAASKAKAYPGDVTQEYDEILSALFEKVPPGEGDEFAAVKPWLGAIKEPKSHPKPNKKAPVENYGIDWIYGYRSEEARMNAQFNEKGMAVYPAAAVGVVFDYKNMTQKYFGGGKTESGGRKQDDESKDGHSDDVTALCMSFSRKMVASGQNGQKPQVFLWNAETAEAIGMKRLPKGCRLVTAIGVSKDDKYVCAADAAEKITCHIFEVSGKAAPIADVCINMKVVHLAWSFCDENQFATAGKDHLAVCVMDGKKIKMTKGSAKGGKIESQCTAAYIPDEKYANHIISGGGDGKVYHWQGKDCTKTYDNNKGSVHSVAARKDDKAGGIVVLVGGNDKTITTYKFDGALTKLWSTAVDAAPRSVDLLNGNILMGLKNGSLVEMAWSADGKATPNVIMTSHCDGEVWGLDVVDIGGGELRIITSADDNRILAYDVKKHKALAEGIVMEAKKKKGKDKGGYKGGASSMSSQPPECQSRCVAYCASLKHLAVANNVGIVTIREVDWAKVDAREAGSLDNVIKKNLFKDVKKAEWIEAMVYSPDSKYLAVGSHDNCIYLLDTKKYDDKKATKPKEILKGHSSFITSIDWDIESTYLRSNCGAYELLFFNVKKEAGKQRDPSGASNTVSTIWADQTCKLGWNVQGIFPPGTDGSHINSVAMSKDQKLIASGDDYGLVCLYRNPLLEGHASSKYRGHSEFVTTVKFSDDNEYLFSVGGQDQTCFQWKKQPKKKEEDD